VPRFHQRQREHEYGQSWAIAAALWDDPMTLPGIAENFRGYLRLFGLFQVNDRLEVLNREIGLQSKIEENLAKLIARGWVEKHAEYYQLTAIGREEARKPIDDMRRNRRALQTLAQPKTVSKVSLGVHLTLAAIKLPAGYLSGSVGLINDALDTLLDGLSSLLVYFGIRYNRERMVNLLLVALMLLTGGFTFYEAIRRFFVPVDPDVDWFAFLAAIVSAVVCGVLWIYQRMIGLRSANTALITQSIDSRNHVIVGVSVLAGLIASQFDFPLLDTIVGLVVAALILKSALELGVEALRSFGEQDPDLSHYKPGFLRRYERFRGEQLRDWMLYLIAARGGVRREALIEKAQDALDFRDIAMLRALGVEKDPQADALIQRGLTEMDAHGWVEGRERLVVTLSGREHLRQRKWGRRGEVDGAFLAE